MASLIFSAHGSHVLMVDGPWEVRVDQQAADELLSVFERINAIRAHTSLYDACQAAGFIPTVSPIRRGPRLVSDNTRVSPQERVRRMLRASPEAQPEPPSAA